MLDWFGRKLREMQEVKRDERGFTLIELLVVVIIIGILAAIAIPTFLSQRDNAVEADAVSGARNIATLVQSEAASNQGSYDETDADTWGAAELNERDSALGRYDTAPFETAIVITAASGGNPESFTVAVTNTDIGRVATFASLTGDVNVDDVED